MFFLFENAKINMQTFAEKESYDFSDLETDEVFHPVPEIRGAFFGFSIEKTECNTIGNRKRNLWRFNKIDCRN